MFLDSFSYTSCGGRAYNQDCVGSAEIPGGGVFVIADGLGGHLHGEVASKCAVDTILAAGDPGEQDRQLWLEDLISDANQAVLTRREERGNMKTTVAALLIQGDRAAWANVGDTRVYYLHNSAIETYTTDHSVAYKKYLAGEITREQIATDEDQSSLLRALGNPERCHPDCAEPEHPLEDGDGFLLCSDGAWEYFSDGEILIDFLKSDHAQEWAERLLLRAKERIFAGNDNLSVITVMVRGEQEGYDEA